MQAEDALDPWLWWAATALVVRRLVAVLMLALPGGRMSATEPHVSFEAVSKWYGDTVALAEVWFDAAPRA